MTSERSHGERGRGSDHPHLSDRQHPPSVHAVGERPAQERHHDHRPELEQAEQPDERRRVRDDEDLVRKRNERRLRAEVRDHLAADEQPVVA